MTLKVNIESTLTGYNYINAKTNKKIGAVTIDLTSPGKFQWNTETVCVMNRNLDEAHTGLKNEIIRMAKKLDIDVEFNIVKK